MIVTKVILTTIMSSSYEITSGTLGFITIMFLITLLVLKELGRVFGGARSRLFVQTLDIVIIPLFLVFGFILAMRVVYLLNTG